MKNSFFKTTENKSYNKHIEFTLAISKFLVYVQHIGLGFPSQIVNVRHLVGPIIQQVRKHWRRRQRVTRWKTYQSSAPILPGDMSWLVLSECG